eukprot:gene28540-31699_t
MENEMDEAVEGTEKERETAFHAVIVDEAHKVFHTTRQLEVQRFKAIRTVSSTAVFLATATPPSDPQFQTQIDSIIMISRRKSQGLTEPYEMIRTMVERKKMPEHIEKIVVGVTLHKGERKLLESINKYCKEGVNSKKRIGVLALLQRMYFMLGEINNPQESDSESLKNLRVYLAENNVNSHTLLEDSPSHCTMPTKYLDKREKKLYIGPYIKALMFDAVHGVKAQLLADKANKIVIFTRFQGEADLISVLLDKVRADVPGLLYGVITGKISACDKQSVLEQFKKVGGGQLRVLILSTSIDDTGLNLQCANIVYNTTIETDPHKMIQCISRVHRQGQTRPVTWIHLYGDTYTEKQAMATHNKKLSVHLKAGSAKTDHKLTMSKPLNHKLLMSV